MVDSHTHLNLFPLSDDAEKYYQNARAAGVEKLVLVGTDVRTCKDAIRLAHQYDGCFASVGIHPEEATTNADIQTHNFQQIESLVKQEKVVAIGECGLDYSGDVDHTAQQELLELHIDLAVRSSLPLIIHCRNTRKANEVVSWNAYQDLLTVLTKQKTLPKFVLHCASGTVGYIQKALELGAYVSFAGNVTYPNAQAIRDLLEVVPLDRLLVETDAPFLAPQSHRGETNEPAYVMDTAMFVATFRHLSFETFSSQIDSNVLAFFGR